MSEKKQNAQVPTQRPGAKEPTLPLSFIFADCKQQIVQSVRTVASTYRLPLWMVESVLESVLSEYRHEAYLELAAEAADLKAGMDEYAKAKVREAEEELTAKFEEGPKNKGGG